MIEIFRHNGKWRIKIINETLEFENKNSMEDELGALLELKQDYESYKFKENKEQENE